MVDEPLLRPGEGKKEGNFTVLKPGISGKDIVALWIAQLQEAADAEEANKK